VDCCCKRVMKNPLYAGNFVINGRSIKLQREIYSVELVKTLFLLCCVCGKCLSESDRQAYVLQHGKHT